MFGASPEAQSVEAGNLTSRMRRKFNGTLSVQTDLKAEEEGEAGILSTSLLPASLATPSPLVDTDAVRLVPKSRGLEFSVIGPARVMPKIHSRLAGLILAAGGHLQRVTNQIRDLPNVNQQYYSTLKPSAVELCSIIVGRLEGGTSQFAMTFFLVHQTPNNVSCGSFGKAINQWKSSYRPVRGSITKPLPQDSACRLTMKENTQSRQTR